MSELQQTQNIFFKLLNVPKCISLAGETDFKLLEAYMKTYEEAEESISKSPNRMRMKT